MKISSLPLLSALGYVAHATTTANGQVYTFDPSTSLTEQAEQRTLSPATARLVLAQRAGVEDYHNDRVLKEDEIDAINAYGSKTQLLGDDGHIRRAFLYHVTAGAGETMDTDVLPQASSFTISPAPAMASTMDLFFDLFTQLDSSHATPNREHAATLRTQNRDIFHLAVSPSELVKSFAQLKDEGTWAITAMIIPYQSETTGEWGTYSMPNAQNPLHTREKRQIFAEPEEPLSAPVFHSTIPENTSSIHPFASSNQTKPLEGILPACFPSLSSCQTTTRNCTGHGSCRLKFTDKDAGSAGGACYSCQCSATVTNIDGKKKTTTWGGPACQKKDVSVEFWLIVLFTVALIFLVGFAVGTVWEMGSQELPSVIGAGVSGPVRKS